MNFTLPAIFGAGTLTFFTPCVMPMIPLYLSALIGGNIMQVKGMQRGALMMRSLVFSLGFILVFSLMGLTAGGIGSLLKTYQAHMQLVGGLFILIFGLKFLGVLQIPLLDRVLSGNNMGGGRKIGLLGAFFMGFLFAAGWSPCTGPILGSVLTYTASQGADMGTGALYLTTYGMGFAMPLLITAAFAEAAVNLLRRMQRHLPMFERVTGIVLLIAAGTLLQNAVKPPASTTTAQTSTAKPAYPSATGSPKMVQFTQPGCSVCEKMEPLVKALKHECHGKKVEIYQVDLATHRGMVATHRLVGVPTFIMFDAQGNEVSRLVGEQDEATLRQALSVLRGEPCPGVAAIDQSFFDSPRPHTTHCGDTYLKPQASCGES